MTQKAIAQRGNKQKNVVLVKKKKKKKNGQK